MPSTHRFVALTVTPGVACKVILPPCSALQLCNAALAAQPGPSFDRCVLECDLATHSFVVASLLTTGVRQAALEVAITNDPNETAWFFLKVSLAHLYTRSLPLPLCLNRPSAVAPLAGAGPARVPRYGLHRRGEARQRLLSTCRRPRRRLRCER